MLKSLACSLGFLALIPAGAVAVRGQDGPSVQLPAQMTHTGKVVTATSEKLVMSDLDGKNEHTHPITKTARILLDGKSAMMRELRPGDRVKVTVSPEGVVTLVEATRSVPTS